MKLLKIAALVAALGACGAHANVGFSSVTATPGVTGTAFATDGIFPADGQYWQQETAWWSTAGQSLVFAFDQPYQITGFKASLDNNDNYVIELSTNGATWKRYFVVLDEDGLVSGGMDTFEPPVTGTSDFFSFARIRAQGGDGLYSVGEFQLNGVAAPVPEPETLALMLGGIAALGLKLRRRAG